jgi:hypothetical protein
VISVKYGATSANSHARGFIGYTGADGGIKEYPCHREDFINLSALTVLDLYDQNSGASIASLTGENDTVNAGSGQYSSATPIVDSGKLTGSRKVSDLASAVYSTILAYYPEQVRKCFIWFYVLDILNASNAKDKWLTSYLAPNNSTSGAGTDKTIYEFGNMEIVKVIQKSDDATRHAWYELFGASQSLDKSKKVVSDVLQQSVLAYDKANSYDANSSSLYFVVAKCNTDLEHKQQQRDERRAKNFLGKYFYRTFKK